MTEIYELNFSWNLLFLWNSGRVQVMMRMMKEETFPLGLWQLHSHHMYHRIALVWRSVHPPERQEKNVVIMSWVLKFLWEHTLRGLLVWAGGTEKVVAVEMPRTRETSCCKVNNYRDKGWYYDQKQEKGKRKADQDHSSVELIFGTLACLQIVIVVVGYKGNTPEGGREGGRVPRGVVGHTLTAGWRGWPHSGREGGREGGREVGRERERGLRVVGGSMNAFLKRTTSDRVSER